MGKNEIFRSNCASVWVSKTARSMGPTGAVCAVGADASDNDDVAFEESEEMEAFFNDFS